MVEFAVRKYKSCNVLQLKKSFKKLTIHCHDWQTNGIPLTVAVAYFYPDLPRKGGKSEAAQTEGGSKCEYNSANI